MTDGDSPQANEDVTARQVQIAANQSIFREVNERLEELNEKFGEVVPIGDFVCECGDLECTQRVGMTLVEYERLRSHQTWFAVRHDHVFPEAERIVERNTGYTVVEKIGAAGEFATENDPRARSQG